MKGNVYHSSTQSGLKVIKPHISTHKKKWVYATKDKVTSAIFLSGYGGDYVCGTGVVNDKPYICERFNGAFDLRYKDKSGTIYELPGTNFIPKRTSWSAEVVSDKEEKPIREIDVKDAKRYLLGLVEKGELTIYYYPNRPKGIIPDDDSDLVAKVFNWYRGGDIEALNSLEKFHPNLVPSVKKKLDLE